MGGDRKGAPLQCVKGVIAHARIRMNEMSQDDYDGVFFIKAV